MNNTISLSQRIREREQRQTAVASLPRRTPEWIRRLNEGKLPNKDLTGKGPDAA